MVSNATFNNISFISWRSVLMMEEIRVPGENHRPVVSYCQNVSHDGVSSIPRHELTMLVVIGTDYIGSCKFSYHTTTTRTIPTQPNKYVNHSMFHVVSFLFFRLY